MESLYNLDLKLNKEYLVILDNILKVFFSYIFLILIEGNSKINAVSLLAYNLVGVLFYNLVFKKIVNFQ